MKTEKRYESTSESARVAAALDYANQGIPVFPLYGMKDGRCECPEGEDCGKAGKHPRLTGWQDEATTDPTLIRQWFQQYPNANVGVYTKDLFVLDVDPRNDGDGALRDFVDAEGPLPSTLTVETGGSGTHYYFKRPKGNQRYKSKICNGLDIKTGEQYVVGVGSKHLTGNVYRIIDDSPIADAPDWLVRLASKDDSTPSRPNVSRSIPDGTRNQDLFEIGSAMRGRGEEYASILAELRRVNASQCVPPLDDAEVVKIAKNAANQKVNDASNGDQNQYRLRFLSERELLERKPPPMLIDGVLPKGVIVGLFGQPASGKSFVALDFSMCVATGVSWCGHQVERGRVGYIVAEAEECFGRRVSAWKQHQGIGTEVDIHFLVEPVILNRSGCRDAIVGAIEALPEPPALLVFDTLSRCFEGDENSSADVRGLMRTCDDIRRKFGSTIILVHHTPWDGAHERGSTVLAAEPATRIRVKRKNNKDEDEVEVENLKQRDHELFPAIQLKMQKISLGGGEASCVLKPTGKAVSPIGGVLRDEQRMLAALVQLGTGTKKEWQKACGNAGLKLKDSTFGKRVETLVSKGDVLADPPTGGKGCRYSPTAQDGNDTARDEAA